MATFQLTAKTRTPDGSRKAGALRRSGQVPAILYGHGMQALALEVQERDLIQALHTKAGENVVITLNVEGANLKESTCLIKEMQHNPVTDKIQHVDFTIISLTEKIEVKVPLILKNASEAAGVKEGGVLDVVHHEIEVECLPTEIPEKIEVDVKDLKIGDLIHAGELPFPSGVVCKFSAEEVVIALHAPHEEEAPAAEETPAQPEVIEKGKKEDAEGEAPPPPAEKKA